MNTTDLSNNDKEQPAVSGSKKLNVLIAEDDEICDILLTMLIDEYCHKIHKAKTGVEAIEISKNNPDIDLILMDIKMPMMNGYDATRSIREFNKNVIIIAQTAYGLMGDNQKALDAGCNDYISKPIESKALQKLLYKYFDELYVI